MPTALLARVLYRSHIVNIRGNGYRIGCYAELSKAIRLEVRGTVAQKDP